jgi:hypothetical protein
MRRASTSVPIDVVHGQSSPVPNGPAARMPSSASGHVGDGKSAAASPTRLGTTTDGSRARSCSPRITGPSCDATDGASVVRMVSGVPRASSTSPSGNGAAAGGAVSSSSSSPPGSGCACAETIAETTQATAADAAMATGTTRTTEA